jgi:hypothetical protein
VKLAPRRVSEIGPLPDGITASNVAAVGQTLADRVTQQARLAQSDFQFASIFEQRRTTATVIQGFGSVSEAVRGMAAAIYAQQQLLQEAVHSSSQLGVPDLPEPRYSFDSLLAYCKPRSAVAGNQRAVVKARLIGHL